MTNKTVRMLACLSVGVAFAATAQAVEMEWVTVADAGNTGELSGQSATYGPVDTESGTGVDRICGAVAYEYSIGMYEVTIDEYIDFLNAVGGTTDTYRLYSSEMMTDAAGCRIDQVFVWPQALVYSPSAFGAPDDPTAEFLCECPLNP